MTSGKTAENFALNYLIHHGLTLVEKNFHLNKGRYTRGEIDLIMLDKKQLVFVEVRLRQNQHYADSFSSITRQKQLVIIRTAEYYLQTHPHHQKHACRFDAVGINNNQQIHWIRDAFQV